MNVAGRTTTDSDFAPPSTGSPRMPPSSPSRPYIIPSFPYDSTRKCPKEIEEFVTPKPNTGELFPRGRIDVPRKLSRRKRTHRNPFHGEGWTCPANCHENCHGETEHTESLSTRKDCHEKFHASRCPIQRSPSSSLPPLTLTSSPPPTSPYDSTVRGSRRRG